MKLGDKMDKSGSQANKGPVAGKPPAPTTSCPSADCPIGQYLSVLCPSCKIAYPYDPYKKPKPKIDFSLKPIVWILGGPGSGKGTQCEKIVAKYGFTHLSTGDLLRDEVNRGSVRGNELAAIMKQGGLVPNEIVLDLLKEAIEARAEKSNGFLIDGYPRHPTQGIEFEQAIAPVTMVKFFEASDDTLKKRLLRRAETSGRTDDNEATIKLRLKTFADHNELVLAQYPEKLKRINAEKEVDEIFLEVQKHLDPIVARTMEGTKHT